MEINGRECEEVKIGDNSFYILEKLQGAEVRKLLIAVTDRDGLNMQNLMINVADVFKAVCLRVNADQIPSDELMDTLSSEDYIELQSVLTKKVTSLFT